VKKGGRALLVSVLIILPGLSAFAVREFRKPLGPAPSYQAVRAAYRPSDVRLLDRSGEVIHELRIDETRRRLEWTRLADISPALQAAVITSEDRRFYAHGGVDYKALGAAVLRWLGGERLRGASTLTMQLASLLDPGLQRGARRRTLAQKWRQMRAARAIEEAWSKDQILETYLNLVSYRGELQGISAATSVLFGKAPHGITGPEALLLAVLLRQPGAKGEAVLRRAWALRKAHAGRSTREAIAAAVTRALDVPRGTGPRVTLAPHAAHRLLRLTQASAPVQSTLDAGLQRYVAETIKRQILAVRDRHVVDGAVLVVENETGDVLAYLGGSGDLSSSRFVDGVRARRQAGSALKPFLYGLALEERLLTPASLLEDSPLEVPVTGGLYRPRNYEEQFQGLVTVRTALAAEAFARKLRGLGFEGLVESGDFYGPSLALGSAEVSLWELVNAYRTLANGGVMAPLRMEADGRGRVPRRRLYSPEAAFLISSILADRESRSVTFGLENPLATAFWSAVKTGTSKDMRDNWCVGYTSRHTVGVWVGNFSGEPMRDVSGITGAAPIWLDVMNYLHRGEPGDAPEPPAGILARPVTFQRSSEPGRVEWFLRGTEPVAPGRTLGTGLPRIIAPASGTIIALDPDIPPSRQRVAFEARGGGPRSRWILDGVDLGSAAAPHLWAPRPGKHRLSLVNRADGPLDAVIFWVRGGAPADVAAVPAKRAPTH
jgi:penicillin-binding protein 1C